MVSSRRRSISIAPAMSVSCSAAAPRDSLTVKTRQARAFFSRLPPDPYRVRKCSGSHIADKADMSAPALVRAGPAGRGRPRGRQRPTLLLADEPTSTSTTNTACDARAPGSQANACRATLLIATHDGPQVALSQAVRAEERRMTSCGSVSLTSGAQASTPQHRAARVRRRRVTLLMLTSAQLEERIYRDARATISWSAPKAPDADRAREHSRSTYRRVTSAGAKRSRSRATRVSAPRSR